MEYTNLKIYLLQRKISQTKLSEDTGLHKNTVSKFLRTGHGSKSVRELIRYYLGLEKEQFNLLLEEQQEK